jgi:lysine-N-methylase
VDRIIFLGIFMKKLQETLNDKKHVEIPAIIARYSNLINDNSLKDSLSEIPTSVTFQMQLLKELVDERLHQGVNSNRYTECFAEMLLGINYNSELSVEEIADNYRNVHQNFYSPFMDNREYILENYLVNMVYKNLFPLGGNDVFDEYVMLVIHYSLIKLHLIGISGYYKQEFSEDHVIKLIQSFSKVVEHNSLYLRHVSDLMKKNGYNTMSYMTILLKN